MSGEHIVGIVYLIVAGAALVLAPFALRSPRLTLRPQRGRTPTAAERRLTCAMLVLFGLGIGLRGVGTLADIAALRLVGQMIFLVSMILLVRANWRRLREPR